MEHPATPEALTARWQEMLTDPALQDLPYKIELNAWGKVEMTSTNNRRGRLSGAIAAALARDLQGTVFISCSILTKSGIRTPDVAWASPDFLQAFGEMTPYVQAPEICVEIVEAAAAPAKTAERVSCYFAAGANEVWLVAEDTTISFFGRQGPKPATAFPVRLSLPAPSKAA